MIWDVKSTYTYVRDGIQDTASLDTFTFPITRRLECHVIADTLPEAIMKVYAEINKIEGKRFQTYVDRMRAEDKFPSTAPEVTISDLHVTQLFTKVIE